MKRDYTPVAWDAYYENSQHVKITEQDVSLVPSKRGLYEEMIESEFRMSIFSTLYFYCKYFLINSFPSGSVCRRAYLSCYKILLASVGEVQTFLLTINVEHSIYKLCSTWLHSKTFYLFNADHMLAYIHTICHRIE